LFVIAVFVLIVFYFFVDFRKIVLVLISWIILLLSFVIFRFNALQKSSYPRAFIKKVFVIRDSYKLHQYIVEDDFWNLFIGKDFSKDYKIWDKVKIYAFLVPTKYRFSSFNDFFSLNINFFPSNFLKFDYDKFLFMKWFAGVLYVKKSFKVWFEHIAFPQRIKNYLSDVIKKLYPSKNFQALSLWLIIWDKSLLDKKIYQQFIDSQLVHFLVVSGWNMMMLVIFLNFLLFFVPFYPRLVIIAFFVILYSMIVGFDSSVFRALIMTLLILFALLTWEMVNSYALLWIAFVLMLIVNPFYLWYDLWFELSFAAVLWIIFFSHFRVSFDPYPLFFNKDKLTWWEIKILAHKSLKFKIKKFLIKFLTNMTNNYILPTLGASLFTLPLILFFIWKFNLTWIIANLICEPVISLILILNIISILLFVLKLPFVKILLIVLNKLMQWVFFVAKIFSSKFTIFIKF
jgi:ComEC/Rec2-related protein